MSQEYMQKIYNWTLYSAIIICLGLVLSFIILVALPTVVDVNVILLPQVGCLVIFLLISLMFSFLNKNRQLRLPSIISEKKVNICLQGEFAFFFILFASGWHAYPNAPITPSDGTFVDKSGAKYTYRQFNNFKKWETAYFILGSAVTLQLIVLLPFYDKESKKLKFEN